MRCFIYFCRELSTSCVENPCILRSYTPCNPFNIFALALSSLVLSSDAK